jgi:radical SAM superfamily enzyme YgiQ (UPF0313 family)
MKICFVIPFSKYLIKNKVLGLTIPQLILNLELSPEDFCIYDQNFINITFEEFLSTVFGITHVFITSITSTFPDAINLAKIAQKNELLTVLGGIFSTMNSKKIRKNFRCFDYIVSGDPDKSLIQKIAKKPEYPVIIFFENKYNMNYSLSKILLSDTLYSIYGSETVSYEITRGCKYNCSFCSMRVLTTDRKIKMRPINIVQTDLEQLSTKWKNLKIIDDDFLQQYSLLKKLAGASLFEKIIVETRVERISKPSIKFLKKLVVSHNG